MGYRLIIVCYSFLIFISCTSFIKKMDYTDSKALEQQNVDLDLLSKGPYKVEFEDYALPAQFDSEIIDPPPENNPETFTQIAGRVYLPKSNETHFPLVVFLHGQSYTCAKVIGPNKHLLPWDTDFTNTGSCQAGELELNSHLGFEYSAKHLASHGFAVISINSNRGINSGTSYYYYDDFLILARGRQVLATLKKLYQWNLGQKSPFIKINIKNKIDFYKVGLMGHSRGGEGVRAAYNIYNSNADQNHWKTDIPHLKFLGVFEIGPVDRGLFNEKTSRFDYFDAVGVAWTLLLPACDEDVSDLVGTNVYRRMLYTTDNTPKSIFTVWGANHNFFNTNWQTPENEFCKGEQKPLWDDSAPLLNQKIKELNDYGWPVLSKVKGSKKQTDIAKALIFGFFTYSLKNENRYKKIFDPKYKLPHQLDKIAPTSREMIQQDLSKELYNGVDTHLIHTKNSKATTLLEWIDQQIQVYYQHLVKIDETKNKTGQVELSDETVINNATSISWKNNAEI